MKKVPVPVLPSDDAPISFGGERITGVDYREHRALSNRAKEFCAPAEGIQLRGPHGDGQGANALSLKLEPRISEIATVIRRWQSGESVLNVGEGQRDRRKDRGDVLGCRQSGELYGCATGAPVDGHIVAGLVWHDIVELGVHHENRHGRRDEPQLLLVGVASENGKFCTLSDR